MHGVIRRHVFLGLRQFHDFHCGDWPHRQRCQQLDPGGTHCFPILGDASPVSSGRFACVPSRREETNCTNEFSIHAGEGPWAVHQGCVQNIGKDMQELFVLHSEIPSFNLCKRLKVFALPEQFCVIAGSVWFGHWLECGMAYRQCVQRKHILLIGGSVQYNRATNLTRRMHFI